MLPVQAIRRATYFVLAANMEPDGQHHITSMGTPLTARGLAFKATDIWNRQWYCGAPGSCIGTLTWYLSSD